MILERNNVLNIFQLQTNFNNDYTQAKELIRLYDLYKAESNEICTKLNNLDEEFQVNYDYNPIHHMETRLKSLESLTKKLKKKDIPISVDNIRNNIFDIAGIRVVTNYIEDIYKVAHLLLRQDDVELIRVKDYIKHPKNSGYRSLHLVVSTPVFQSSGTIKQVPVEVQIRTIGMDMWASLEHKLKYKTNVDDNLVSKHAKELTTYSTELNEIEKNMQRIHNEELNYVDARKKNKEV